MSKNPQLDLEIRFMGMVGLVVMAYVLSSAALSHLPESPNGLAAGLVPTVKVELPHSKAEMESILGEAGSESRKIIGDRWAPAIGLDFATSWLVYLYFLSKLFPSIEPRMRRYGLYVLALAVLTMLVGWVALHRTATLANSATFTEDDVRIIRILSEAKWFTLFVNTMLCDLVFMNSRLTLRVGQVILTLACVLGEYGALYANPTWISWAVSVMFVTLGGISILLLWKPAYMYEM